ncbi:MAG: phage tail sheath C-terminal domain-containing protein [Bacteroidota bacterium]
MDYKTPGVYIEERSTLPPSVVGVETAIPVFIGYTETALDAQQQPLLNVPKKITSMLEYERFFGKPAVEGNTTVTIREQNNALSSILVDVANPSSFKMYYALQFYFENGGSDCYIVSVNDYTATGGQVLKANLDKGLEEAGKVDEITLIVFPDAQALSDTDFYDLYKAALDQCVELQDRFTIMDVWSDPALEPQDSQNITTLRSSGLGSSTDILKYGAVYYPNMVTSLDYYFGTDSQRDGSVQIVVASGDTGLAGTLGDLKGKNNAFYFQVLNALTQAPLPLAPSSAVAGVMVQVDNARGVWKAPANVNINNVIRPAFKITDKEQESLNVDVTAGKSINAIRSFTGRGPAIIWGSRTLAGNDNEWRYVPVRRFFNFVEESVKKATVQFVFEPNDVNTWIRVQSMIENFLVQQWKAGALMGATPEQAFRVKIGLGQTMTEQDIFEGRMIIEIGMAVVRPAEFIILRFEHKMLNE